MLKQALAAALVLFLLISAVAASGVLHPDTYALMATDAALIEHDIRQDTAIANINQVIAQTQIAVQPSPTPRTLTPTPTPSRTRTPSATNTAQGVPDEPTIETLPTLSKTPTFFNATNTRTPTRTITNTPQFSGTLQNATATLLPYLELDYSCHVKTLDDMTRRLTPGVTGVKMGTIPEGTELLIYPNDSTLMFDTNYWYVRIHEDSGGGYVFFAYTIPPEEMEPGVIPRVVEAYLQPSRAGEFCQPTFPYLRN